MKKILLFSLSILILTSFRFVASNATIHQVKDKRFGEVETFLKSFEKAVFTKDPEAVIPFFDQSYVKEQRDNLLNGDSNHFLNEFFCGNLIRGEGFECVIFDNIKKLKCLDIQRSINFEYTVSYKVIMKNTKVICDWTIKEYNGGYKRTFGLVGAVG